MNVLSRCFYLYDYFVYRGICAFLGNYSWECSQNFFAILWIIVTVKRITVKVR